MTLTVSRLKNVLDYSAETGKFRWKELPHKSSSMIKVGQQAGWSGGNGYLRICIDQETYYVHRLAWLYVNGKWPRKYLDHINGDTFNNKISNLREATRSQNKANTGAYKNNTSGYKGAYRNRNGWASKIRVNKKLIYLGNFRTAMEAHKAYCKGAVKYFGPFARAA